MQAPKRYPQIVWNAEAHGWDTVRGYAPGSRALTWALNSLRYGSRGWAIHTAQRGDRVYVLLRPMVRTPEEDAIYQAQLVAYSALIRRMNPVIQSHTKEVS